MQIFKTTREEKAAKAWLHDVVLAAGMKAENKRKEPLSFDPDFARHAKLLMDEFLYRRCDNVDESIHALSKYPYNASLVEGETVMAQPTPEQIAKYIIFLAKECETLWDFTDKNNLMDFGGTILGHHVFLYRQYVWMRDAQSGIQHPADNKVYKIEGRSASHSQLLAQINPASYRYAEGDTNKVLFEMKRASENHCTCFFFDRAAAEEFLEKLKNSDRIKTGVTDLRVQEQPYVEEGGYIFFGTEFGPCAATKQELENLWRYEIHRYRDGNPLDKMSDEAWEAFVEALHREY